MVRGSEQRSGSTFEELGYLLYFKFLATNNNAKYETTITGLNLAARLEVSSVELWVSKECKARNTIKDLQRGFASFKITKVHRKDNE